MDLSAKLELLKQTPYFASLSLSEIRELVPRLLERHYRAGDVIFRKGDPSEGTNGWTKEKVDSLLNDLSNHCLSPHGTREPIEDSLVGAVCTMEIDDYFRAQNECLTCRA